VNGYIRSTRDTIILPDDRQRQIDQLFFRELGAGLLLLPPVDFDPMHRDPYSDLTPILTPRVEFALAIELAANNHDYEDVAI
jgi:hypothetical protein